MSGPALVLVGHDVHACAPPRSDAEAHVSIALSDLTAIVERLQARGYRFVGLAEFLRRRHAGGVALLTFDDAYASVRDVALPALKALGAPMVIFVVAEALARPRDPFPVWLFALRDARDSLGQRFAAIVAHPLFAGLDAVGGGRPVREVLGDPLSTLIGAFRDRWTQPELETMGEHVAAVAPELRVTLGPEALTEMLRAGGVELGAHSLSHRSFAMLAPAEVEAEIRGSVEAVARFCGRRPDEIAFAYPYGANTAPAQRLVAGLCAAGFTCHGRPVSALDADAALPRINLDADCAADLDRRLAARRGLSSLNEQARLHLRTGPAWRLIGPIYRRLRPDRHAELRG